jgi:hypothetical protein
MSNIRRRSLRAAAFASFAILLSGSPVLAQETNTIGPPQLRDFQLPGQRTTPPATPPAPAPTTTVPAPAPTPRRSTVPTPAPSRPAATPAEARRRAAAAPPVRAAERSARPAPAPADAVPAQTSPPAPTAIPLPPVPAPVEPAPPQATAAPSGWPWWWFAVPLLPLAIGGFLFLRRRRRTLERDVEDRAALAGALRPSDPPPAPQWLPEPEPVPEPVAEEAPRPWLELDIVPERAAATDQETVVHYELVLRNSGAATARNIRIDERMFNAGADGDIAQFFGGPIHAHSGSPHVTLPGGDELRLQSAIGMPKAEMRAIEVQGRAIFVPMVAINVAYDWEGGTGRSSKSWLIGREAQTPSAKMGPFRLDLGPRIYRQVGRRDGRRVMV